ncbi:MAG: tetratricopeptide repeat protein [Pseudomonadota bacterium]
MNRYSLIILIFAITADWVFGSASLLKQLLQENRAEEAVPICRQYEVLPSRDEAVNFACAWVYYRTYRADAAELLMQKLKNSSSLPEYQLLKIYGNLAIQLLPSDSIKKLEPAARQEYEEKIKLKLSDAQREIQRFLDQYKTTPVGKMAQELSAEFYELKGQLEPAAFLYRGFLAENPKSGRAHWGLGRYYLAQGDLRRAKTSLEKTAELWPKHIGSRYNLALIAIAEGSQGYREAARWLAEAFKLDNADVGVLEQIGVLLEAGGKPFAAIKYWQRALQLNPQAALASKKLQQNFSLVVQDLVNKKKWNEALVKIDQFSPLKEEGDEFSLQRGICYRHLGEFQKASEQLSFVVQIAPENPLALRELGIAKLNLKRTDEALQLFEKSSRIEKNEGWNFAWLGFALEAKKDYLRAAQAWNQAASLLKDPSEIKQALEKLVRLEQKTGTRAVAGESEKKTAIEPKPANE